MTGVLALKSFCATRQYCAEGKRAQQRSRKHFDRLPAAAKRKRVDTLPIDMRSVTRWSTSERPTLMRGRESRDNPIRAAMGRFIGCELFVDPETEPFQFPCRSHARTGVANHAAFRNQGETVRLAGSSNQSKTRFGGAAIVRCSCILTMTSPLVRWPLLRERFEQHKRRRAHCSDLDFRNVLGDALCDERGLARRLSRVG